MQAWLGRRDAFEAEWRAALPLVAEADLAVAWYRRGDIMRSVLCHPSEGTAAYERALDLLPGRRARAPARRGPRRAGPAPGRDR